ncbi:MAG: ribokinase [Paracoccaceae bacterium]
MIKLRKNKHIFVFGVFAVDISFYVDKKVKPGETIIAKGLNIGPGGKASNQAISARKLGATTTLITRLGSDNFCSYANTIWKKEKLYTSAKIDKTLPTGVAGIFIDDKTGENSVIVHPGASARLGLNDFNSQKSKMRKGDIFLTQFEQSSDTTFSVLKEAKKLGMITIFNPAPFGKISKKVYQFCEIVTPNETEAEQMTNISLKGKRDVEKAINKIRDLGVEKVIITLGKKGAAVFDGEKLTFSPGNKFGKIIDTTGAGDCFNGALASALSFGKDLTQSVKFSCAAAGLSVLKRGTAQSSPTRVELNRALKTI